MIGNLPDTFIFIFLNDYPNEIIFLRSKSCDIPGIYAIPGGMDDLRPVSKGENNRMIIFYCFHTKNLFDP